MRVICVAGARPNYMKVKPVMDALEERGAEVILVHTGQHYDAAMSDVFFTELGIRPPDHFLGAGSGTHAVQTCRVMTAFEPLADKIAPDVVVVVGDVNSTLACALVAAKAGITLAHVEAGLRSGDRSMPEEINRLVTDRVSDYLFVPSTDAVANLRAEGFDPAHVHLVGNVMVDTLLANADRAAAATPPLLAELGLEPGRYGLVTLHRPANVDDPAVLSALLSALAEISRDCPLVLPAHPRTATRLQGLPTTVTVIPPAGYLDFIALEASARLVLTDSGGAQEETTVLGVPCLTLRDNTERPVTVTEGTNQLVGRNPERIVKAARAVMAAPVPAPRRPALWDGLAGQRVAAALVEGHHASYDADGRRTGGRQGSVAPEPDLDRGCFTDERLTEGDRVLLRSPLEQATYRIVVRRRLPAPFAAARILRPPKAACATSGAAGRAWPLLLRLAAEMVKPGDTVWDIGANLGLFSLAVAVAA